MVLERGLGRFRFHAKAYSVVASVFGWLLVIASALKGYLLHGGSPLHCRSWGWGLTLLAALCEGGIGLWLLSGLYKESARRSSLFLFGCLAAVAAGKSIAGESSCGCFGRLEISPITTLLIDITAITCLCVVAPAHVHTSKNHPYCGLVVFMGVALVGIILGVQIESCRQEEELAEINPSLWLERQLPLLAEIDIGDRLMKDRWMVVFYKNECAKCQERIPHLLRTSTDVDCIALIEVPSKSGGRQIVFPHEANQTPVIHGHLRNGKTWIVETPLVVSIRDSIVMKVSH